MLNVEVITFKKRTNQTTFGLQESAAKFIRGCYKDIFAQTKLDQNLWE